MKAFLRNKPSIKEQTEKMTVTQAWLDSGKKSHSEDLTPYLKDSMNYARGTTSQISSTTSSSIPIQSKNRLVTPPHISSICSTDSEMTLTAMSDDDERSSSQIQLKNLQYSRFKDTPNPYASVFVNEFDKLVAFQGTRLGTTPEGITSRQGPNMKKVISPLSSNALQNSPSKFAMNRLYGRSISLKSHMKIKDKILLNTKLNEAATLIQKTWRGYHVRYKNQEVQKIKNKLRIDRMEEYLSFFLKQLYLSHEKMESMHQQSHLQEEMIQKMQDQLENLAAINESQKKVVPTLSQAKNAKMKPKSSDSLSSSSQEVPSESMLQMWKVCSSLQRQIQDLRDSLAVVNERSGESQAISYSKSNPKSAASTPSSKISNSTLIQRRLKGVSKNHETSTSKPTAESSQQNVRLSLNRKEALDNSQDSTTFGEAIFLNGSELAKVSSGVKTFACDLVNDLLSDSLKILAHNDQRLDDLQILSTERSEASMSPDGPSASSRTYNIETHPITIGDDESVDLSETFLNHLDIESLDAFF